MFTSLILNENDTTYSSSTSSVRSERIRRDYAYVEPHLTLVSLLIWNNYARIYPYPYMDNATDYETGSESDGYDD